MFILIGHLGHMKQNLESKLHDDSIILEPNRTQVEYSENQVSVEPKNLYYLFTSMIYLMLKPDSNFLYEFSFIWTKADL